MEPSGASDGGTGAVAAGAGAIMGTPGAELPLPGLWDQSSPAQSPGIGGGFPAQFVDPCRRAWPRCCLDPPELQVRPPGLGPGSCATSRLMTQCSRIARTVYSRPRQTNRAGLPSSLARTLTGSPYTLFMPLPASLPAAVLVGSHGQPDHLAGRCRMEKAGSTIGDPGQLASGALSVRHAAVCVGGTFVVSPFTYVGS